MSKSKKDFEIKELENKIYTLKDDLLRVSGKIDVSYKQLYYISSKNNSYSIKCLIVNPLQYEKYKKSIEDNEECYIQGMTECKSEYGEYNPVDVKNFNLTENKKEIVDSFIKSIEKNIEAMRNSIEKVKQLNVE